MLWVGLGFFGPLRFRFSVVTDQQNQLSAYCFFSIHKQQISGVCANISLCQSSVKNHLSLELYKIIANRSFHVKRMLLFTQDRWQYPVTLGYNPNVGIDLQTLSYHPALLCRDEMVTVMAWIYEIRSLVLKALEKMLQWWCLFCFPGRAAEERREYIQRTWALIISGEIAGVFQWQHAWFSWQSIGCQGHLSWRFEPITCHVIQVFGSAYISFFCKEV